MRIIDEILKWLFTYISGVLVWAFGYFDPLLKVLIVVIIADVISGFLKALYNKNINSKDMFMGGIRKVSIFIVITVAVQIDTIFNGTVPLREITLIYYIATEGISFSENISNFISLPKDFTKFFKDMKERNENENA